MRNVFLLCLALVTASLAIGCSGPAATGGSDSPTEAYKRLYTAVKSKNTEAIKKEMSKRTQGFAAAAAQRQNVPVEKVFENGLTATTFSETLPEIRDERINGNMGAIEVWNAKDKTWEDLPYVLEEDVWKLAIGDVFSNTYKSPGKGRSIREGEAANMMSNTNTMSNKPGGNANTAVIPPFNGPQVTPESKSR